MRGIPSQQLSYASPAAAGFLVLYLCLPALLGQTDPSAVARATIRTTSREVILDVVVRGKNGRMVRNLQPGEVEVFENGVRQKINDFRFVEGKAARETEKQIAREASSRGSATVSSLQDLNVISIVFAAMAPDQRLRATRAVEQFLRRDLTSNMLVGLFALQHRLYALNPYTNDANSLAAKLARAATMSSSELKQESAAALSAAEFIVTGGRGGISTSAGIDATSPAAGTASADFGTTEGAQVLYSMLNQDRIREGHSQGMDEMDALENLVAAQARLPGRKSVIYLATGVSVPPDFVERFRHVLSQANRAGVTFYTINVAGLQTMSPMAASRAGLSQAAGLSTSQSTVASSSSPFSIAAASRQDDVLMRALHGNSVLRLRELAESTGGFVIENTNNIAIPMSRILEETSTHYAIAYTPQIAVYDGSFRAIEVRVARPKAIVQTRSGYFALPEIQGKQLTAAEAAALKVLNMSPLPAELPFGVATLRFQPGTTIQYSYVAELSGSDVAGREDAATHAKALDTVVFALVKNDSGEVVQIISKEFSLALPLERWAQFQSGKIMFAQPFYLPPGRYSVETAVLDRISGRSAVRRSALIIPARAHGPELSSVVLVRSVEQTTSAEDDVNPFHIPFAKINPTLSNVVLAGARPRFYFVAYPSTGTNEHPDLTFAISKDGRVISREKVQPVAKAGEGHAVLYSPNLPDLAAGTYEVTVSLLEAAVGARQNFVFTVE